MNKSPQDNQQETEPNHWKFELEPQAILHHLL